MIISNIPWIYTIYKKELFKRKHKLIPQNLEKEKKMELIIICSNKNCSNVKKPPSICLKANWRKAAPLFLSKIKGLNFFLKKSPFFNSHQLYSRNCKHNFYKNTSYSHYCQAVISRPTNFLLGLVFQSVIVKTKSLHHTICIKHVQSKSVTTYI